VIPLKLLKECNEAKFALLERGPSVLNLKGMEERLDSIQTIQLRQMGYDIGNNKDPRVKKVGSNFV
jgi:hypothetical protein